jgi:hypothetical protein
MSMSPQRSAVAVAAVGVAVGSSVAVALAAGGASLPTAAAGGALSGLFALVVVPLVVIARRVGSAADDPVALERRLGAAAGRSDAELDALTEWDERRGRLVDPAERPTGPLDEREERSSDGDDGRRE